LIIYFPGKQAFFEGSEKGFQVCRIWRDIPTMCFAVSLTLQRSLRIGIFISYTASGARAVPAFGGSRQAPVGQKAFFFSSPPFLKIKE